jgi:dolichol-phosphate mannosyltransferase
MQTNQQSVLLPVPDGPLSVNSSVNRHPEHKTIRLSLIIPTYNESKNITALVEQLTTLFAAAPMSDYELIVVDDDSPDRTWAVAQSITAKFPALRVMRRQTERGLSTAVIRGWQVAQGDYLGVIDGDLQHPPEVLLGLLKQIQLGADFAIASRHVEGGGTSNWGLLRQMLSRGAQILGLIILPSVVGRVSDPMSGCFIVRRDAIADVILDPLGYKISLEVLGRGRIEQIAEVGYVFQERQAGESKVTRQQYSDYLQHLLKLRSRGRVTRLRQNVKFPLQRFLRFGAVGLSGVLVDMLLFYLFSDPTMMAMGLTRSKIFASEIAILNNFLWNDLWTFRDLSRNQSQLRQIFKRFLKFNMVCLMGLTLNVLLLNFLFNVFGINRYIANFIAIGVVTIWNFWINLKLNWRVTDVS